MIGENVRRILAELPSNVELVGAAKTRTPEEVLEAMGKPECLKVWTVKMGERLDVIAHKVLRDPLLWRAIAELNDIADPLTFPGPGDIGRPIFIPDTATGSGSEGVGSVGRAMT